MRKKMANANQPTLLDLKANPPQTKTAEKPQKKSQTKPQMQQAVAVRQAKAPTPSKSKDPAPNMLSLIGELAINPKVDAAKMQQIMDMQFRLEDREAERKYNEAMTACTSELPIVIKDKKGEKAGHKYAPLESIALQCMPIIHKHGFSLSFSQGVSHMPDHYRTICRVRHVGGHSTEHFYDLPLDNVGPKGEANKTKVQGVGSTTSYAQRYLTALIFNITLAGEDNDGARVKQVTNAEAEAERIANLPIPSDGINEDQQTILRDMLTETNKEALPKFLGAWKIPTLAHISKRDYDNAYSVIKQYKDKNGPSSNKK